jgi:hypothetical protein
MSMTDKKEHLKSMLQNFIQDNQDAAQLDFHEYVSAKMGEVSGLKTSAQAPEPELELETEKEGED